ncbi:GntR family transcriptional regulator (plasmid) [Embleya sp. NBC_00888]|uniref:GntR family transcriptional regulator n=1 Tax=Embleya sp. NBC_00888 TaxID=2975960 RepID=UPI0038708819|nr:GntR family transcriptional regulator [Embleya sp. NBC_00888]
MAVTPLFTYKTKADLVADSIRELVRSGEIRPGDVLRQRDLAERFEVSATPVREALSRLEAEGLLVVHAHRGASVVKPAAENKAEIYGIRAALEGYAAELACARITDEELARVVELNEHMKGLKSDDPDVVRLNREFHEQVFLSSHCDHLTSLIRQTWNVLPSRGPQVVWRPHAESIQQHQQMVDALTARDPERLGALTRNHILGAIDHMNRALGQGGS